MALDGSLTKPKLWEGLIKCFPYALEAVARLSEDSMSKHGKWWWDSNQDKSPDHVNSLLRHLFDEAKGNLTDKESESLHTVHECWRTLARLETYYATERQASSKAAEGSSRT